MQSKINKYQDTGVKIKPQGVGVCVSVCKQDAIPESYHARNSNTVHLIKPSPFSTTKSQY